MPLGAVAAFRMLGVASNRIEVCGVERGYHLGLQPPRPRKTNQEQLPVLRYTIPPTGKVISH
jgi:hypothetical protein